MRKILITIAALIVAAIGAPLAALAQTASTPFPVPVYYASAFSQWSLNGQSPNTYTFQGRTLCNSNAQNTPFFVFKTNAPIFIQDSNSTNNEIATPSAIVNTAGSCGVTMAPSHSHYSFQLRSGTAGLQEAINSIGGPSSVPATLALDRNWWAGANQLPGTSGATVLGAAAGNIGVIVVDQTTAPVTNYIWNGTAYVSGSWVNTVPTSAAGAAAGTSPTIAQPVGTTLAGSVALTTGSATTTGTLFTLTYATTAQFLYAPTCTVTSSGANSFTAFTVAAAYGSSHATVTVTATSAPTAATAYAFTYSCK